MSLRGFRNRLHVHHGYELSKKPRELDCLIIDIDDSGERIDNEIARIFARHNIVELKNPVERLDQYTMWKVVSYASQYISDKRIPSDEVTMTILRASKPDKLMALLRSRGYDIRNEYPGIYYISGIVDIRMQIVVSRELEGDDYVPLRLQRVNADSADYVRFSEKVRSEYSEEEFKYVKCILKYGL